MSDAQPFDFKWGPDRLACAGIHLDADQVACAQTTGKALIVTPLLEPDFGNGSSWQVTDEDGKRIIAPVIQDVVLNGIVTEIHGPKKVSWNRQELLDDYHNGPDWRKYAQTVVEFDEEWLPGTYYEPELVPVNIFSTIMVDDDTANRIYHSGQRALAATDWMDLAGYIEICNNGLDYDLEDEHSKAEWQRQADIWEISPALDDLGFPVEVPKFVDNPDLVPNYQSYMEPHDWKLWERLVKTARHNWEIFEEVTKVPKSKYANYWVGSNAQKPFD